MSAKGPVRSLFGGPLSTRQECTNREALQREKARLEAEAAAKARKAAKKEGGSQAPKKQEQKPPSTLPPEPPELKKKRQIQEALDDFDDLCADGPAKPKPKPKPPAPSPPPPQKQPQQQKPGQKQPLQQQKQPLQQQKLSQQKLGQQQQPKQAPTHQHPNPKLAKQPQPQRGSTPTKPANGALHSKPAPSLNGKSPLGAKKPVRRAEDEFEEEDRLEMERARRSLGRDVAMARRKQDLKRRQGYDDELESDDLDDFVVDDEEDDEPEWRKEIRALTGYDPRKYQNERFDDRSMEAGYNDILAEERRSARVAREEDKREEEEERKRLEAKARAKKKQKV